MLNTRDCILLALKEPIGLLSTLGGQYCQEVSTGSPLGATYSGKMNVTTSGKVCVVWDMDRYDYNDNNNYNYYDADMGEHNYCRNPIGDPEGVWCYTADWEESEEWEHCSNMEKVAL